MQCHIMHAARKETARRGSSQEEQPKTSRRFSGQTIFLLAVVVGSCFVLGYIMLAGNVDSSGHAQGAVSRLRLKDIPFNGARAYDYLKQICQLGRRPSGSPGMAKQQEMLTQHFQKLGGQVSLQKFEARHPETGQPVPMANLIVQWHPERTERILLCAHYDTLPYPMLDRRNPRGRFIGANDGASGVALLMELAHDIPRLNTRYGIDFVLFDGEEFIFHRRHPYFLGSTHFAKQYADNPPGYRYRWGVLLDMIGDKNLQIPQEQYSLWWKDTRPLVADIWATARRLGVNEFVPQVGEAIRDDHLPLHDIGGIPCIDIIDFDYPPWHTRADTPDKCSPLSLAKVGWVIREWLAGVQ